MTSISSTIPAANYSDLQIAYQIGVHIASQVPCLEDMSFVPTVPWAYHKSYFSSGPNPYFGQMAQGLLLVERGNSQPSSILTRYGEWRVLGASSSNFYHIFNVVKKTLNLKEYTGSMSVHGILWSIQSWNGKTLKEPIP